MANETKTTKTTKTTKPQPQPAHGATKAAGSAKPSKPAPKRPATTNKNTPAGAAQKDSNMVLRTQRIEEVVQHVRAWLQDDSSEHKTMRIHKRQPNTNEAPQPKRAAGNDRDTASGQVRQPTAKPPQNTGQEASLRDLDRFTKAIRCQQLVAERLRVAEQAQNLRKQLSDLDSIEDQSIDQLLRLLQTEVEEAVHEACSSPESEPDDADDHDPDTCSCPDCDLQRDHLLARGLTEVFRRLEALEQRQREPDVDAFPHAAFRQLFG